MPHLHLSLQSGDDLILKRMKRRHSRDDAIRFCDELRRLRPETVFGADIIAGFPTETDAMFDNTRRVIEECGLALLHVFPFSPREPTPAARMPQVPQDVKKRRAEILRALGDDQLAGTMSAMVGQTVEALVERPGVGRSQHFLPVELQGVSETGAVVAATIVAAGPKSLNGQAMRVAA